MLKEKFKKLEGMCESGWNEGTTRELEGRGVGPVEGVYTNTDTNVMIINILQQMLHTVMADGYK